MKRETIVFTDRDTMKQSEEISPQGYSHGDNNLDLSWARCDARPNGEDRDQPQVLEFSDKRGLGSFRGVIMKLLSRSEFLVYSLLIGLLAFGSFQFLTSRYPDQEVRDRLFFICLPICSEVSFWVARYLTSRVSICGAGVNESFFSRSGLEGCLSIIPVVAGSAAFLVDSPAPSIGLLVLAAMLSYHFARSKISLLRFAEIIEVPLSIALFCYAFTMLVLVSDKDPHHWAFYLGPAYAVFGGGHLLWDVPSQYGFLNVLSIATVARLFHIDVTTSMSFFVISLELIGIAVTFCLFRFRVGLSTLSSALCVTALQHCLPSWIEHYAGPAFTPSTSALRFAPALVALITFDRSMKRPTTWNIVTSAVCVAISTLWSPESCLYTAAPLLVFGLLSLARKPCLAFFTGPFVRVSVLVGALVGGFLLCYARALPQGVDPVSFYEYATTYSTSFGLIPITLDWWTGLFVFTLGVSYFVARKSWSEGGSHSPHGALFFTYIFCIATYFVARSSYRNVHNLIPWMVTALAAVVVDRSGVAARARLLFTLVVGALSLGLFISLYNGENQTRILEREARKARYIPPHFDQVPPQVVEAAREVTHSSQFTFVHDLAVIYNPSDVMGIGGNTLPISPVGLFGVLPVERQRVYIARMLERASRSYVLCIERVCPVVPYTLQNMKDLVNVVEVPFPNGEGWKLLEISKR